MRPLPLHLEAGAAANVLSHIGQQLMAYGELYADPDGVGDTTLSELTTICFLAEDALRGAISALEREIADSEAGEIAPNQVGPSKPAANAPTAVPNVRVAMDPDAAKALIERRDELRKQLRAELEKVPESVAAKLVWLIAQFSDNAAFIEVGRAMHLGAVPAEMLAAAMASRS